jgi:quercetin dioxygenase-like cupin family protein
VRADDGRLELRLKRPWRDGTTAFVFQPRELIERLVAIVPRPRAHLIRYSGVLAPAFAARAEIVPIAEQPATPTPAPPPGAEMPRRPGADTLGTAFTLRFKMPSGYKIPPHWHTQDEQLTILSGTFVLHMGDTMDAPAHELKAGAYHFPARQGAPRRRDKAETVLQLHGNGPFDIHYLNPADNPNPKPAGGKTAAAK